MKRIALFMTALPLFLAACSQELTPVKAPGKRGAKISVSTQNAKATLGSDFSVSWKAGDGLALFASDTTYVFTADADGSSSTFTTVAEEIRTASEYFAVYPNKNGVFKPSVSGNVITTELPNYQIGVKDGFDPKAAIMVGRSEGTNFHMKNVPALLKLTIPQGVASVIIGSNDNVKLAGELEITLGPDGTPTAVSASSSTVLLAPSDGETFEAGVYYVAVAPCTSNQGLYAIFATSDGYSFSVKTGTSACTLSSSKVKDLSDVTASATEHEVTYPIDMTFSDGTTFSNQFTISPDFASKEADANYGGYRLVLYSKEDYGSLQFEAFGERGFTRNGAGGWRVSRTPGDYVQFPSINGCSLKLVRAVMGAYSDRDCIEALTDTEGNIVAGGEAYLGTWVAGNSIWFSNLSAEPGKSYRFTCQEGNLLTRWFPIRRLVLYYTGELLSTIANVVTDPVQSSGANITMNGSLTMLEGDASETTCGFEYRKSGTTEWTSVNADTPGESFSKQITVSEEGDYEFRAWASIGEQKLYGPEKAFFYYKGLEINLHLGSEAAAGQPGSVPATVGQICYRDAYMFPSNGQASGLDSSTGNFDGAYANYSRIIEYDFLTGKNMGQSYMFRLWATYGISRATGGGLIYGLRYNPQGTTTIKSTGKKVSYGGKDGLGWMQLPAIEGYALKSVSWHVRVANAYYKWALVSDIAPNDAEKPTSYSIADGAKTFGTMDFTSTQDQTITLEGAQPGVGYYMITTLRTWNVDLQDMVLFYQEAE